MLGEGVEALDDDEHVVDADPEEEEGQHAVHRTEHQTEEGAASWQAGVQFNAEKYFCFVLYF